MKTGDKRIIPNSWYILDATKIIRPQTIRHTRFISRKAAELYVKRRFSGDFQHYIPIKGIKLIKFEIDYAKLKKRFYSKYAIPNSKILSRQGKKTFRTTMRRKLYGYVRKFPYSHKCDRCTTSRPWYPKFCKLRPELFNGRKRKVCDGCYAKKHGFSGNA